MESNDTSLALMGLLCSSATICSEKARVGVARKSFELVEVERMAALCEDSSNALQEIL
jgi:hypothetical protein